MATSTTTTTTTTKRFVFPNFLSLREGAFSWSCCGPDVELAFAHVIDPARWPMNGAALAALVHDMTAHGCTMNAAGMTNIYNIDHYFSHLGWRHHTAVYPGDKVPAKTSLATYSSFRLEAADAHNTDPHASLHNALRALAGPRPYMVLVEWSHAGAGLHDDESQVLWHYSGFGGYQVVAGDASKSGYYRTDGDSRTDPVNNTPTGPILTGWPAVVAAVPQAFIILEEWPASMKPSPVPAGWRDDGTTLFAPNGGSLTHAMRWYVRTQSAAGKWLASDVPIGWEISDGDGGMIQHFQHFQLHWRPGPGPAGDGTNVRQEPLPAPSSTPPPSSPPAALTVAQAHALAVAAGFSTTGDPAPADIAVAIAQAESGLHPDATNTAGNTPPSTDRGIMQINSYWHPEVTDAQAFDPAAAFKAAFVISKQGTDFTPWATYGSGAYKQFMPPTPTPPSTPPPPPAQTPPPPVITLSQAGLDALHAAQTSLGAALADITVPMSGDGTK